MRFFAREVADATGGRVVAGSPETAVEGAAFDSRLLVPGQLFVALRARRDGHDFIAAATAAGAPAYLTEGRRAGEAAAIVVDDTLAALGRLGAAARLRMNGLVVAITGSTGKTSAKDLCRGAFGDGAFAAEGSFNNEIGLPLTFIDAPVGARAVISEMGARGPGHLTDLCRIAQPHIGIVTNVGMAHVGMFGSVEAIARSKAELPAALPESGIAILPAACTWLETLLRGCAAPILLFGTVPRADVVAENVTLDSSLRPCFRLRSPWGDTDVRLLVVGEHQVANALAAAGAALYSGIEPEHVARGLGAVRGGSWRLELTETREGVLIVNDAYNSNPQSLAAALDVVCRLAEQGRRPVVVLGRFAELGDATDDEHRRAGACIAKVPRLAALIAVDAPLVAEAAQQAGVGVYSVDDVGEAIEAVRSLMRPGDAVLVKGSRVAGLERVAHALIEGPAA